MPLRVLLPVLSHFPTVEISVDNARTHQAIIHSKPSLSDDDLLARRRHRGTAAAAAAAHHHQVAHRRRSSCWSPPRAHAGRAQGPSKAGRGATTGAPSGRGCDEEPLRRRPSQRPNARQVASPLVDGRWDAGGAPSLGRGGCGGSAVAAAPADTSPRVPARVPVRVAVPQMADVCPRLPKRNYS